MEVFAHESIRWLGELRPMAHSVSQVSSGS